MRIWHDDIRPKPEGWDLWVRTNDEALAALREHGDAVEEISLDHDLGLHTVSMPEQFHQLAPHQQHAIFLAGRGDETGYDLVVEMMRYDLVPPIVNIHSWNPAGATRMAMALSQLSDVPESRLHTINVVPFDPENPPCR